MIRLVSILFLLCAFFISFSSYGQKFLAIDKGGRVKRIKFFESDFIHLKTNSDSIVSGQITRLKDTSFVVERTEVSLSSIKYVSFSDKNYGLKLISTLAFTAGIGYFTLDSGNRLINNDQPIVHNNAVKVGSIFMGVAFLSKVLSARKFRIGARHPIKIIDISID